MLTAEQLAENYARVRDEIATACRLSGRDSASVRLLAVSKLQPAEAILAVANAGQREFGENYVQEALEKRDSPLLSYIPELKWHMTGHVQSRKAPQVAGSFALIHTLDSKKLAHSLEKHLGNATQDALIEVNIADEPQKSGIRSGELMDFGCHILRECPHIQLRGLMCLPPVSDSGDASRPWFARLRTLRDQLSGELGLSLPELSMGMSGDFGAAIAEGATIVRIGTAIFGPRPVRK